MNQSENELNHQQFLFREGSEVLAKLVDGRS